MVRLKTTRSVVWVSGPDSKVASPQGIWSVVAGVNGDRILMLAKDQTVIQIPSDDVVKVADYDIDNTIQVIKRVRTQKDYDDLNLHTLEGDTNGKEDKK